jgi:Protein of unknown function (DUF2971)
MQKIYKYRPLSESLFKELYYQEMYFASYNELNDPLDLSPRMEFSVENEDQIEYLLSLIFRTTYVLPTMEQLEKKNPLSENERINIQRLMTFTQDVEAKARLRKGIFDAITRIKENQEIISIDHLESIVSNEAEKQKIGFEINFPGLKAELQRLQEKFLANSSIACFTEINNDFLMWSHYASKHTGICIEFTLETSGLFPYKIIGKTQTTKDELIKGWGKSDIGVNLITSRINKVIYQDDAPCINFFDFSQVFANEDDYDLIHLQKAKWHGFAYHLESIFGTKTNPWQYEKEWRAIQISFENKEPEARIRHYPIECISSIYFGLRTPETIKTRIRHIFQLHHAKVRYFDCVLTNGRDLDFKLWGDE